MTYTYQDKDLEENKNIPLMSISSFREKFERFKGLGLHEEAAKLKFFFWSEKNLKLYEDYERDCFRAEKEHQNRIGLERIANHKIRI